MAPLVDLVFLQLIYFLLTWSFLLPAIRLQLPGGLNTDKEKHREIIVTVDRDRHIYVNLEQVSMGTLELKLREKLAESADSVVVFRGDKRISYDLFVRIADIAKRAGARNISITHQVEAEE